MSIAVATGVVAPTQHVARHATLLARAATTRALQIDDVARAIAADRVVRIHLQLAAYPNATYQGPVVADPNPSSNAHDIYVRRSCSCQ